MSLLLFFLVSINVVFVLPIPALGTIRLANPMHFDLIHRHSPQLMFSRPITRIERVNDLVHNDNVRVEIISRKVGKRGRSRSRRLTGSSPVIPILSGASSLVGSSFRAADGVLGLGYSNNSFVLKAGKFGNKFSYCLVDHLSPKNVSSYLTFGPSSSEHGEKSGSEKIMSYTPLILGVINGFYPVSVLGISIGGLMLPIPKNIWDLKGEGGVIIDSGTSLTFLAEPAYQMVMAALKLPLMVFKPVDIKPFEFCFNSLGFNEALVPKLVIHFDNSADFAPPVKSYVIDVSDDVKCLGFMSNGWPEVSIIGNIMQQNFLWEFDIDRKRLGFVESTCK
ncbi:hypothetical protein GIB67_035320 [Kingdonia uniflora]|uniref:Peptidase A1 domain-containing protein n=1 Tax=Kingdonia uniflora TaxID=39325 RepID=A0A7J7KXZ8_9MAGN|nr:hypothetical protein GIB67_035320 [Kingdonia uniflora]